MRDWRGPAQGRCAAAYFPYNAPIVSETNKFSIFSALWCGFLILSNLSSIDSSKQAVL